MIFFGELMKFFHLKLIYSFKLLESLKKNLLMLNQLNLELICIFSVYIVVKPNFRNSSTV